MSKKEIIITVVVGLLVTVISAFLAYNMNTKTDLYLKVDNYTLKYGKYKGIDNYITLNKDSIIIGSDNNKYEVKGKKIYINGNEMLEVTGNNKMILLAGAGVEYNYEEK